MISPHPEQKLAAMTISQMVDAVLTLHGQRIAIVAGLRALSPGADAEA